jgi:hypothetical protein
MNRDLYRLIKGLKKLSASELARVQETINELRAADLREVRADLKAVVAPQTSTEHAPEDIQARRDAANDDRPALGNACCDGQAMQTMTSQGRESTHYWCRRAFQDIAADDLRSIAELYREANASRAVARQRFGAH